jgi:hypothetical protein
MQTGIFIPLRPVKPPKEEKLALGSEKNAESGKRY